MNEFTLDLLPAVVRQFRPEWGIVLGSGLAAFVDGLPPPLARLDYADIPGLPASTVPGHAGCFLLTRIGAVPVVIASGRVHLYEGHSARAVTAGIRCLAAMGVSRVVLTNAAGSLNPAFNPGTWMMLSDHLNLTGTSPFLGTPTFLEVGAVYCAAFRQRAAAVAADEGIILHEGVYAGVRGPEYETPAEARMLRLLGADAVGMSTIAEAVQAHALSLKVAAFSCLTNWSAGGGETALSHAEVIRTGTAAAGDLLRLLSKAIPSLAEK